jgi:hypothetical protein
MKMREIRFLAIFIISVLINSCATTTLKPPIIIKEPSFEEYKYVIIQQTGSLTSGTASVYGGQYGLYGSSSSKSINPSDVISGILMKEGFVILPDIQPELIDKTLIVNYGESGRRNVGFGYTIEVTIKFISAMSYETIASCTAEGMGSTEADDIRIAINRCLSGLFQNEN